MNFLYYTFFFLFALSASIIHAQICDGNLGENIFLEGDFGSGSANIPQTDPGIAPGYIYLTNPPPDDGFYTLTNDMTQWPFAFGWLEIQDNSPNPNGYMMVVNASFEPGLFYEQEVDGLCDNTLYEFSADVFNLLAPGSNGIRPNISFLLDGNVLFSTGNVPENGQWNTYGFTFTTEPGQTSLTLALRNNAPGGQGNDIALDNITFRPCGPQALILPLEIANICEDGEPIDIEATILGDQYDDPQVQWQQSFDEGLSWQDIPGETSLTYTHTNLAGGFYYYRYLLANSTENLMNAKCRVVSNVKIIRVVPKFYTIVDTLCEGLSFQLGNNAYSQSGTYTDSLLSFIGCDSIVTLELTIVPDPGIEADFHADDPSCSYLQDGSILLDTIIGGKPPYQIFFEEAEGTNAISLSNLSGGNYPFSIIDRYGCSLSSSVELNTPSPFFVDLEQKQTMVNLGESVDGALMSNYPISNFLWEPPDLIIDCRADCATFEWLPTQSMLLSLTATSQNGCIAHDSLSVKVNIAREIYIPNIFSPDFDGYNDYFTIFGPVPAVQAVEQLLVFDRWGALVFERENLPFNSLGTGWDGRFRGKEMPTGVYTYLAKIRFLDGEIVAYAGEVTLVR
jgi:gliding motility-associated-like protein